MALCFEVTINQDNPVAAGAPEANVLSAIVSYVTERNELTLEVGGLASNSERLDWISRDLKVGDVMVIRIVESNAPDPPVKRHRDEPSFLADQERAYYERLRRKYEKEDN
jgi:hypothetical protein